MQVSESVKPTHSKHYGSRISHKLMSQSKRLESQPILANCPQKLHKNEEYWTKEGARPSPTPSPSEAAIK